MQPSTTKTVEVNFAGEGRPELVKLTKFVNLNATIAEMEALKPRYGDERDTRFDFLTKWKEGAKFDLVEEMGGLMEDLPDGTKTEHQKGLP